MKNTGHKTLLNGIVCLSACMQFLFFSFNSATAQMVNKNDSTSTIGKISSSLDEAIGLYGSLRFKAGASFDGEFGMRDQFSRLGIKLRTNITSGIDAIGQLEVGVNMVGTKTKIQFNADPGGAVGEIDNIFTSRIGWVGISTRFGQLTWGKQWSVYYDIAQFTDAFYGFGGDASGTYAAGTDGSISGTGRPANSFQYRFAHDYFALGLQVQNRSISPNSKNYADTYAMSVLIKPARNLQFGAAYNQVRDGVAEPDKTEPRLGDEAMVGGIQYDNQRLKVSFTATSFTNHEIDEQRRYFSGYGYEFYTQYRFLQKWSVYTGFNYLQAKKGQPVGDYCLSYLDVGASYSFSESSLVFVEIKFDDSQDSTGTPINESIVAFGLFLNFGY